MIDTKVLYGITRIDETDFDDSNEAKKINLKYYKIKRILAKPNKKKFRHRNNKRSCKRTK